MGILIGLEEKLNLVNVHRFLLRAAVRSNQFGQVVPAPAFLKRYFPLKQKKIDEGEDKRQEYEEKRDKLKAEIQELKSLELMVRINWH